MVCSWWCGKESEAFKNVFLKRFLKCYEELLKEETFQNKKGTRWSAYLHHHAMPDPVEHIEPNTFLRYRAIYRFWPDLSMLKNHFRK